MCLACCFCPYGHRQQLCPSLLPYEPGRSILFLVSGFFFSKRIQKSGNTIFITKQYVFNIICLYCIWILFWSPVVFREYRQLYGDSTIKLIATLFRRFALAGMAPYWYLLVLAEGIVILACVFKSGRKYIGMFLCAAGLILRVLYSIQPLMRMFA